MHYCVFGDKKRGLIYVKQWFNIDQCWFLYERWIRKGLNNWEMFEGEHGPQTADHGPQTADGGQSLLERDASNTCAYGKVTSFKERPSAVCGLPHQPLNEPNKKNRHY
jgi:hypothetical protein